MDQCLKKCFRGKNKFFCAIFLKHFIQKKIYKHYFYKHISQIILKKDNDFYTFYIILIKELYKITNSLFFSKS